MNITAFVMKGLAPRARSFEKSTRDPIRAQERILFKYLARNKNTEYGKIYKFSSIRSIRDYSIRVPLCNYETLRPYIDRMKNGEENILVSDKVIFFGITSGTTGTPKLVPVTRYSQARKADLMNLWAYYACRDHPHMVDGRILSIISPEIKSHTASGIPYGPEDGHAYNNLPAIVKRLYVLPYSVFYIENYDARYYCILRISMEHDISTIATLNPSTLVLLCRYLPAMEEKIIDDIEHGTLDGSIDIPSEIRLDIENDLKPNPKRAGVLKDILKKNGTLIPRDFWPHLDLIECWKGGSAGFYLSQLSPFFGNVSTRDFGCLSTEARSSVPMSDKGAGGVLAVQSNFYEFLPKEDMDKPNPRLLLCDEVEVGGEYLLIVTTAAGIYRYNIDDVVKVDGFFNKTPVIEFIQKGHNAVSITGEKIYESHINGALGRAIVKSAVKINGFTATISLGNPQRYVFMTEFTDDLSREKKTAFLRSMEDELRSENSEYDDLRKQKLIAFPTLLVVRSGEFERYRRERVKNGAHDTQFKMPKLVASPDFRTRFLTSEEILVDY